MEIVFILFMLVAGGGLAVFVITAMAVAAREAPAGMPPDVARRDSVAASILYHIVSLGGVPQEEAMRAVRRGGGLAAPVTRGIDVANWAESFAHVATEKQRHDLLETAVQLVAARSPIPLRQYAALLDLSFGLGFHTDALARLRELYGFDYVDHARDGRPKDADRSGGGAPLYVRGGADRTELLRILGVSGTPSRQELSAAYRKLAAQHHPDRYHGMPGQAQSDAATRFIEITRAYEALLQTTPE